MLIVTDVTYYVTRATFGLRGALTFLPIKKMPESVRVEIGMQTQTFTIFESNETTIIGKIVKVKACTLNSINSLNVISNVLKEKVLPCMAFSESANHLVHRHAQYR